MRTLVAVAVACLSIIGLSHAKDVKASIKKTINIPAQGLGPALQMLSKERDIHVVYVSDDVSRVSTQGVSGELTVDEALSELLKGTGLTYEYLNKETVSVLPRGKKSSRAGNESNLRLAQAGESSDKSVMRPVQSNDKDSTTEEVKLEEIVVTAQRREQRPIDVPISITVMSGAALEGAGIQNIQDLSYAVPGMSAMKLGPGSQDIAIRGISGARGPSSTIGVYVDEMGLAGNQVGLVRTYSDVGTMDLNRVEVLKGPQGTLFGEGSMGGAIRYLTNDPDLSRIGGKASANFFGNEESKDTSGEFIGILNVPVIQDQLGFRIVAKYQNDAGWIDRLGTPNGSVIENDFNDYENTQARIKGLWKPFEDLEIRVLAIHNRGKGGGFDIVNEGNRSDSSFIYEFDPDAPLGFSNDYNMYNLTGTYAFGDVRALSSTSYSDVVTLENIHQRRPIVSVVAGEPTNTIVGYQEIFTHDQRQVARLFSQELRLSSANDGALSWTVGGNFKSNYTSRHFLTGFDFLRFNTPLALGLDSNKREAYDSESWAAFGDVSYALTTRLELGAGIRYFEDRLKLQDELSSAATLRQGNFSASTWRSYLTYKVLPNVNVYGSVATGFRSGGFNAVGQPPYEPEELTSYELGTKMKLADGRIRLEVALFRGDYTDMILSSWILTPANTVLTLTQNVGEAKIEGVEAAVDFQLTDRFSFSISGDITDAVYTKTVPLPPPQRALIDAQDPIEIIPEYSYSFGATYAFNWTAGVLGHFSAQYNVQGKSTQTARSNPFNNATFGQVMLIPQQSTPELNLLNVGLGADWESWSLKLYGKNVLNEEGPLRPGNGLTPQARPRTVGITIEKSF